jgi:type III restriction enzyme
MPRKNKYAVDQPSLLEARVSTASCVPGIRNKVKVWREGGYMGATDTTRLLLNHWFCNDPRLPNGTEFQYHYFQREVVETLIYLYEVANIRRHKNLVETFATRRDLRLLQYDDFSRYCAKMATGSGKTKVMALAIAWQFFNAVAQGRDDYAKTFLLIAPNVIVFERLRTDFEVGRIFNTDPVIPNELRIYWDFQCYMRGEGERAGSLGALYLSNIQQFYERQENVSYEPDVLREVLGAPPPPEKLAVEDVDKRIMARGGPLAVLNDEAHHTHDEESEWNKIIRQLNKNVPKGVAAQFDFTATPRHSKGQLFSWTVFDYQTRRTWASAALRSAMAGVKRFRQSDGSQKSGQAPARSGVCMAHWPALLVACRVPECSAPRRACPPEAWVAVVPRTPALWHGP